MKHALALEPLPDAAVVMDWGPRETAVWMLKKLYVPSAIVGRLWRKRICVPTLARYTVAELDPDGDWGVAILTGVHKLLLAAKQ